MQMTKEADSDYFREYRRKNKKRIEEQRLNFRKENRERLRLQRRGAK